MDITVTTETWNGTRELSLNAYVQTWVDQTLGLSVLASNREDYNYICEVQEKVKAMAVARFFELYQEQNG